MKGQKKLMDDKRRMYKYPLNGSGVKVQMIQDGEKMSAACVTLQMSAFDRPKCVEAHGGQIDLYVETHDTESSPRDKHMHDQHYYIVPTGALIPETALDYIDTCTDASGLVWHIFQGVEPR